VQVVDLHEVTQVVEVDQAVDELSEEERWFAEHSGDDQPKSLLSLEKWVSA
jgi:acyl dehydratase